MYHGRGGPGLGDRSPDEGMISMFHGSIVALVTPMTADGAVDFEALERLVEFHVESGTDAIVSVGTTGESATLNTAEHCEVIGRTIGFVAGRLPVIAGTGANPGRNPTRSGRRSRAGNWRCCR